MNSEEFNKLDTDAKIGYFSSLPQAKQKELFSQINEFSKEEVLNNLDYRELKKFLNLYTKEEKKDILKQLMPYKLKYLYSIMDEKEKIEFNDILNEMQIEYTANSNQVSTNITNSQNNIQTLQTKIINSQNNILNAKENIKDNKKEIKNSDIRIKKISKERQKQFKKMLKRAKPSILDRIGFIAKIRRKRLQQAIEILNQIDIALNNEISFNQALKGEIQKSKDTIEKELNNIERYNAEIQNEQSLIQKNEKIQKELNIRIKKLNAAEKRIYGRKLYQKRVSERNLIGNRKNTITNSKENVQENDVKVENNLEQSLENPQVEATQIHDNPPPKPTEQVEQSSLSNENKAPSKEEITNTLNYLNSFFGNMSKEGITFEPLNRPLPPQPNQEILNDKVATISNEDLITLIYTTIEVQKKQMELMEQMQQRLDSKPAFSRGYSTISILFLIISSLVITSIIYLLIN